MAVPPLRALVDAGHDVALCVTRPDRRRGRGGQTTPSPVKATAGELGIAVSHDMDDLLAADVELAVVVAFGRIIPARLLEQLPMVNLHFSLLPRWRGAAPVERAILAGDDETGVCLMKIEEGLDSGPVYATRTVPIDDEVTLAALREQLVAVASSSSSTRSPTGCRVSLVPQPQHGEVTIAEKITQEDLHLQWDPTGAGRWHGWCAWGGRGRRSAAGVWASLSASSLTASAVPDGRAPGTLHGTYVSTGEGSLVLRQVQPESRSPMSADEWLRGVRPENGERLGTD